MKNTIMLSLIFLTIHSFSQSISRGPDVGEIYFRGPTYTDKGLYHSTDFGETAICVDSIKNIITIAADATPGGIYCYTYPISLYYSPNYGNANSWEFKNTDVSANINSGIISGHIFSSCSRYSEDFGENFIYTSCNGCFGSAKNTTIDITNESIGYVVTKKLSVADTLYLFRTYDKFENTDLLIKLNYPWYQNIELSSGINSGIVYMFDFTESKLWISYDFFDSYQSIDTFNLAENYITGIEGGKTEGEFYILNTYYDQFNESSHIYIYHSTDYGKTFEVFHPFSKGSEPVLANFSTIEKEVHLTTPIEFSNFSIGDIQEYQWDFNNDGVIDSYEETPTYYYQDTGWYSVKLSVIGLDSTNTFTKENYIHVIDTTTIIKGNLFEEIAVAPNPFKDRLTIKSDFILESFSIIIYNLKGEIAFETFNHNNKSIIINTSELKSGVYVLNISGQNNSSNYKIIKK